MYMTTRQAADAWCPMVRVAACEPNGAVEHGQSAFNRLQNGTKTAMPDAGRCIADKCAMWRWAGQRQQGVNAQPKGYCGLAGTPSAGMAAHP